MVVDPGVPATRKGRPTKEPLLSSTDAVEKIGGRPPQSLKQFVGAHITEFSGGPELQQQTNRDRRG